MKSELEKIIEKIKYSYDKDPPASNKDIEALKIKHLPSDYIDWLSWGRGGEGRFGAAYLSFWPANEILQLNRDFKIQHYLGNDSFCFASDGGSVGYVFKLNGEDSSVWKVPLGDLDWSSAVKVGSTFLDTLEAALKGELSDE